jgi:CRISPR/Cas system endoribonuclease Cas6 (RAMP superfamily)
MQSEYMRVSGIIEIYEKGGTHLLTLTPIILDDPSSKIEYVQIRDGRFKTEKFTLIVRSKK